MAKMATIAKFSYRWLFASSGMVAGIMLVGGLTRLTNSGLSMVDWSFIHFSPPKTEEGWNEYFEKYKQYPEYKMYIYLTVEETVI